MIALCTCAHAHIYAVGLVNCNILRWPWSPEFVSTWLLIIWQALRGSLLINGIKKVLARPKQCKQTKGHVSFSSLPMVDFSDKRFNRAHMS